MAAVKKVEKSKIIDTAFEILRNNGIEALNARSLARALNCSTKPIYFEFENMDELKRDLKRLAENAYVEIAELCRGKYENDYIAHGMAYLKFAKEEKHLFQYLYLKSGSRGDVLRIDDANYDDIINIICERYRLDREKAKAFHYDMAIYSYGLAVMVSSGFRNFSY